MRIAYVCADRGVDPFGFSGSSTHVREMLVALAARGHDVTLLAANAGTAPRSFPARIVDLQADASLAEVTARMQKAGEAGSSRQSKEVRSLLRNLSLETALSELRPRPDLVYERQSLWSIAGLRWARRSGVPHLLEVNAPLVEQQREYRELELAPAAAAIEAALLSGSDRVLVTAAHLADYARAHGASRRKVRLVPCGVATSRIAPLPRPARREDDPFVVGFVGSLKPWHGIDVLLRAFRKLHRASKSYRLLIVGDGPLRGEIERFLSEHQLGAFAELTGEIDPSAVAGQLARMHVGVAPYPALPSFYFSPLKVWEYAAAGVPIAASSSGELPRLFAHRQAAMLHPPGSASRLAEHVELIRTDPTLGAKLARRARQRARLHTWDRLAARVERIATDAIRQKKDGGP